MNMKFYIISLVKSMHQSSPALIIINAGADWCMDFTKEIM